ncbi:MAG: hypothetical protein ACI8T1_004752 [Verrucomicrobiales bacterium]|jgi:hypothetical protein
MQRMVEPEILDSLPPEDPAAQRSRRDLVRINALMGNLRWIRRMLEVRAGGGRVIEVGAGDGRLASALSESGMDVTAVDLAPRPSSCSDSVRWVQGDVNEVLADLEGDILVASLFWHHFQKEALQRLAPLVERFRGVVLSEPWRARHALWLGSALVPVVNSVTRHDMFVSIKAGFRRGELPAWWDLCSENWDLEETGTALGAYRLQAWRKE